MDVKTVRSLVTRIATIPTLIHLSRQATSCGELNRPADRFVVFALDNQYVAHVDASDFGIVDDDDTLIGCVP